MWMVTVVAGVLFGVVSSWECPQISNVSCSCDLPHTLRCTGPQRSIPMIAASLKSLSLPETVSLLDCTIQGLSQINSPLLEGVSLHGLVVSSGILRKVSDNAFSGLKTPLRALGLPNNQLNAVPTGAISKLNQLIRLDVSHNLLHSLSYNSFEGLGILQFLDLATNQISTISPNAFASLKQLKVLKLGNNDLNSITVTKLQGLINLEELDLSGNAISGPLNSLLPSLPKLTTLNLAHNQLSCINEGALAGLDSLQHLILQHNMIDVLEDHAFRELSSLSKLDLAYNRIVAVSESSLSHLGWLSHLDLSHNFLRALTSDLVSPLSSLKELILDDNDISMILGNALDKAELLETLSLTDNPLNCDCNLSGFVTWLKSSNISDAHRKSAVCATPPSLENGLAEELTEDQMVCNAENEESGRSGNKPMPVSGTRVTLRELYYDGASAYLLWLVDTAESYRCDTLFIYEELGAHEILLETKRLDCESSNLNYQKYLPLTFRVPRLQKGHRYRFCVVLVETESQKKDSALILGCSEILNLAQGVLIPHILLIKANASKTQGLKAEAELWPEHKTKCLVTFSVFSKSRPVQQIQKDCSSPRVSLSELNWAEPLKVCATLSTSNSSIECTVLAPAMHLTADDPFTLVQTVVLFAAMSVSVLWAALCFGCLRTKMTRPKLREQCFIPNRDLQQTRYTKLQATTKV